MWFKENNEETLLDLLKKRKETLTENMERFYTESQKYELLYQARSCSREFIEYQSRSGEEKENGVIFNKMKTFDFNIIRQNCIAAKNQITSSRPKVVFLGEGDVPYETIQISEKLGTHISRMFEDQDVYMKAANAFLNACIMQVGILKLNSYKSITNLHPKYFMCSNPYSGPDTPREAGNYDLVSPYMLRAMFPKKAKEITEKYIDVGEDEKVKDVLVFDLYYKGERNVKFTEDMILSVKSWNYDFVPYEFFRWEATTEGVLQKAISDELSALQKQLRIMVNIVEQSFERTGIPKLYISKGAQLADTSLLENEIGAVVEYVGDNPPVVVAPNALSKEYFEWIDKAVAYAAQVCGNNPVNMSGELPQQLNQASGIALQNYSDLDSKKFSDIRHHYEKGFMSLARKIILMGGKKALSYDRDLMNINIKEELSNIRLSPASILPDTPAGQIQTINAMIQANLIPADEGLAMLKHPDVKKLISSKTDRIRQVDLLLEEAMKEDKMPVLYKEFGVDVYLDRSRKMFATIQRQKGEDFKPLVKLSIFIDFLLSEMQQDQGIVVNQMSQLGLQGPQPQTLQ